MLGLVFPRNPKYGRGIGVRRVRVGSHSRSCLRAEISATASPGAARRVKRTRPPPRGGKPGPHGVDAGQIHKMKYIALPIDTIDHYVEVDKDTEYSPVYM